MGVNNPKWKSNFAIMVLGASYGSLAGGFGTEIGTAPNLMAAAYTHIPFVDGCYLVYHWPLS